MAPPPPISGGGVADLVPLAGPVDITPPPRPVEPKRPDPAVANREPDHPTKSTHTLCAAIARGDRAAFAQFYESWFDRCYAMARSLTRRDESFCLDVVQNAMLRVVRSIKPMPSHPALARWMVRAVHSSAIDLLRSESRARRRDRAASRPESTGDPSTSHERHMADWLASALATLDEQDRAMLRLRFAGDATLDTVGHALGTTGDVAHGRLRRALAKLRRTADPP